MKWAAGFPQNQLNDLRSPDTLIEGEDRQYLVPSKI